MADIAPRLREVFRKAIMRMQDRLRKVPLSLGPIKADLMSVSSTSNLLSQKCEQTFCMRLPSGPVVNFIRLQPQHQSSRIFWQADGFAPRKSNRTAIMSYGMPGHCSPLRFSSLPSNGSCVSDWECYENSFS